MKKVIVLTAIIFTLVSGVFIFKNQMSTADRSIASFVSGMSCPKLITEFFKKTYYNREAAVTLDNTLYKLLNIDGGVISGLRMPTYHEKAELSQILESLRQLKQKYQFPTEQDRIDFFERILREKLFSSKTELNSGGQLFGNRASFPDAIPTHLDATEAQEMIYTREILKDIESYFSTSFGLKPLKFATPSLNPRALIQQAQQIVARQNDSFAKSFNRKSGFANMKKFSDTITARQADLDPAVKIIREEQFEIAIPQNSASRQWIADMGIDGGFARGQSTSDWLSTVEAKTVGLPLDQYRGLDQAVKPKHGYIHPKVGSGLQAEPLASPYRFIDDYQARVQDIYILKEESIQDRLTWSFGDIFHRNIDTSKPSWDQRFIPWESRDLMIPLLSKNMIESGSTPGAPYRGHMRFGEMADGFEKLKFDTPVVRNPTLEVKDPPAVQVWGPVKLADVKEFIFKREPPEGEFLEALVANKIKIIDGRRAQHGIFHEWAPPSSTSPIKKVIVTEQTEVYPISAPAGRSSRINMDELSEL